MHPTVQVNLQKIRHNAAVLTSLAEAHGISLWGVPKGLVGAPAVGEAMLQAGVTALAESRLGNLRLLAEAGLGPRVLLRLPSPQAADQVVALADISLNSQLITLQALSQAALRAGTEHGVLLMVDLGDLREGVWPDDLENLARRAARLPGIKLLGLGTNLTCYGGVIPSPSNLGQLVQLAQDLETKQIMQCEILSGGNSSSLRLLMQKKIPSRINNLRLGESILLGREALAREAIPGLYTDAVTVWAEVIEVSVKPSVPIGCVGQDAFGNIPAFEDLGWRRRAILAIGRQDVDPEGLTPLEAGVAVLGASSDHLILDVTEFQGDVAVGQAFGFVPNYSAMLRASTSADMHKVYC